MIRVLAFLALSAVGVAAARTQSQWQEAKFDHYSILYQAGSEADVPVVRGWADADERVMREKYGVAPVHYRMNIYLLPAPTAEIDVGRARNTCCTARAPGDSIGKIEMLAPSSPAMRQTTQASSLGMPKNDTSYHAKILMSEYIPIAHYEVQNARRNGGWRYYDAPNWFVQGLQEYDAIFHTTARNRTETAQHLFQWARGHASAFTCCTPELAIADDYNGGASFMAFLAAQFGEAVHLRLLQSSAASFFAALSEVTRPYSREQLFERLQAFLADPHQ